MGRQRAVAPHRTRLPRRRQRRQRAAGAALLGAKWPQHPLPKYGSYLVDTTLLATGITLIAILPWGVFANGWLAVKLPLVVVYVILGVFAMRPRRTRPVRFAFYLAALATFGFIYGIARMHNPLGWLLLF